MSATFDFDRALESALDATGPTVAPAAVVDAALARARSVGQRRRFIAVLDRRSWPPRTISLGNPTVGRLATIAIVALVLAALAAAAIGIGARLLRQPSLWTQVSPMNLARDDSAMVVLLTDGRVLALGGRPTVTGRSSKAAEVYDPASNAWTAVADMVSARTYGTATLLPDGKVLVAGGGDAGVTSATAELFDPATGTWTQTGDMIEPHNQHAAILLRSGEVLVAGGTSGPDGVEPRLTTELYDPNTGTWRATGPMVTWRASPTITLLPDGNVLVVEGFGPGVELRTAEIYDPARGTWRVTGNLTDARADDQTATLLPNGKVLVVGGDRSLPELYDPATRSFATIAPMPGHQRWHTATLLPDGRVLFAGGGLGETAPLTTAVLYDPAGGSWTPAAPLAQARMAAKAVRLRDGSVLVVGGVGAGGVPLASVERFGPRPWSLFGGD